MTKSTHEATGTDIALEAASASVAAGEVQLTLTAKEKELKETLELMLRASRSADKKTETDSGIIALKVSAYLDERKAKAGTIKIELTMKDIQQHCYDLAGYNPKGKNVKGGSLKSAAFEMRVIRGIRAAILSARQYNPTTNKDDDVANGYRLDDKGHAMLPSNVIVPRFKIDGQEMDNPSEKVELVTARHQQAHWALAFGIRPRDVAKTSSSKYAQDVNAALSRLTTYINGLAHAHTTMDMDEGQVQRFKRLEDALNLFFEERSKYDASGDLVEAEAA